MKVQYRKVFFADLAKINDNKIIAEVEFITDFAHSCHIVEEIPGFKLLRQYPGYGRIEVSPFRIGVEVIGNTIIFKRILPRDEIYKQFP